MVKGSQQITKPTKCPYPGCGRPIVRIDLHMKSVHKIKGEELENYKKMVKEKRMKKKRQTQRKETEKVFLHTIYVLK